MCEFRYNVEGVIDNLESFYATREMALILAKEFLETAKKINEKYKAVDLKMEIVDFERGKRVNSKITWGISIKPNFENGNYIVVKTVLDGEKELFERVQEQNVIYELKTKGRMIFKGNSEELDVYLIKTYKNLESVPKNWANEYDLDIYYYDKYNEIRKSLY